MVGLVAKIAISAVAFLAIMVIVMLTDDTLFKESQTFIPKIQANASDFAKNAWIIYSAYGLEVLIYTPIFFNYMFLGRRGHCFYYVFVAVGVDGLTNMLKLIDL